MVPFEIAHLKWFQSYLNGLVAYALSPGEAPGEDRVDLRSRGERSRAQGTRQSQSAPTMIKTEVGNSLPGIKNVFKILLQYVHI